MTKVKYSHCPEFLELPWRTLNICTLQNARRLFQATGRRARRRRKKSGKQTEQYEYKVRCQAPSYCKQSWTPKEMGVHWNPNRGRSRTPPVERVLTPSAEFTRESTHYPYNNLSGGALRGEKPRSQEAKKWSWRDGSVVKRSCRRPKWLLAPRRPWRPVPRLSALTLPRGSVWPWG